MTTDTGSLKITITGWDTKGNPTGHRRNGSAITMKFIDSRSGHNRHAVNMTPTYVHRLYFAGEISDEMIQAAERLQDDFAKAGMEPKVASSYDGNVEGYAHDTIEMSVDQEIKKAPFRRAVTACGPYCANVVIGVVCFGEPPETMDGLLMGLRRLAKHYGMRK